MLGFIALVWDSTSIDAVKAAQDISGTLRSHLGKWKSAYQSNGVEVFCTGLQSGVNRKYQLGDGGVVLGVLFDRLPAGEYSSQRSQLSETESLRIRESCGRQLVEKYWGRYVAILQTPSSSSIYVIRDPSGAVDCFSTNLRGVQLFLSSLDVCPYLDMRPAIDWQHVAGAACCGNPESATTGLRGISHVLRGQCLEARTGSTSFYWSPADFAASSLEGDYDFLANELRKTVRSCVHSWASCYESICQTLSGGLDSSILMSAANDAPTSPQLSGLNYFYLPGSGGDERETARIMANHVHRPLIERELVPRVDLAGIFNARRSDCPTDYVPYYIVNQADNADGPSTRTDVRFHGFGGDQLLYQNGGHQALADYVLLAPSRNYASMLRFAAEIARAEHGTVWSVLSRGCRLAFAAKKLAPAEDTWIVPSVIPADVRKQALAHKPFAHDWLKQDSTITPGKLWQIHLFTLAATEGTYGPFWKSGDPENVSPLASQPLVELCLRIPSYVLMTHGRDRALARHAFREDLPTLISRRTIKGSVHEHPKDVLDFNREFIRQMLLDGSLVREGILDRVGIENALSSEVVKHDVSPSSIFSWLSIEAWIQRWQAHRKDSIAA